MQESFNSLSSTYKKILDFSVIIIVLLFALHRYQDIHYPYLHDEVDVYGQGALYMYDHYITLLPGVIPSELSRGHPLLFYAIYGLAFKVFGPTVEVGHSLSLFITSVFLFAVYALPSRIFNRKVAFCSFLIVITNPMVIAQSTLVHPEIFLALLTLLTLFFYLKKKLFPYVLFASLGVLTKETAIILPILIILLNYTGFAPSLPLKNWISKISLFVPIVVFVSFFTIQKAVEGWFFFPLHINYVSFGLYDVGHKFLKTLYFFAIAQGRFLFTLTLIVILIIYLKRGKVFLKSQIPEEEVFVFLASYIIIVVAFSCLNFLINRYFIIILSPISLITSYLINKTVRYHLVYAIAITSISLVPTLFFIQNKKKFNFDVDLNYQFFINNQLALFKYLESLKLHRTPIYANYPLYEGVQDPRFGYVKRKFNLKKEFDGSIEYLAISNIDIYDYYKPRKDQVILIKIFKQEYSEIYLFKIRR